jgi:uncharacterized protein YbcV (DUF1398 family)
MKEEGRTMNAHVIDAIEECTKGSDAERLSFPEVAAKLAAAGIEHYHADLQRAEKTYYLPDGDSRVTPTERIAVRPAREFSAAGVDEAVRAIQAGRIFYREFCARIMEAGCVGYFVSIVGRRAVYYGRTIDYHVEPFPAAK